MGGADVHVFFPRPCRLLRLRNLRLVLPLHLRRALSLPRFPRRPFSTNKFKKTNLK